MSQTHIDDWSFIEKKIEMNKSKRIPYKSILGESLTSYVTRLRDQGLSSSQVMGQLVREPSMAFFIINHIHMKEKLYDMIQSSICGRFSEQKALENRLGF